MLYKMVAKRAKVLKKKQNSNTCTEYSVFMKSNALSPEGRGLYQQCHVVLWKTYTAWQCWEQAFFLTDGSLPCPAECHATLRGGHQLQTGTKLMFQLSLSLPPVPTSCGV